MLKMKRPFPLLRYQKTKQKIEEWSLAKSPKYFISPNVKARYCHDVNLFKTFSRGLSTIHVINSRYNSLVFLSPSLIIKYHMETTKIDKSCRFYINQLFLTPQIAELNLLAKFVMQHLVWVWYYRDRLIIAVYSLSQLGSGLIKLIKCRIVQ